MRCSILSLDMDCDRTDCVSYENLAIGNAQPDGAVVLVDRIE